MSIKTSSQQSNLGMFFKDVDYKNILITYLRRDEVNLLFGIELNW